MECRDPVVPVSDGRACAHLHTDEETLPARPRQIETCSRGIRASHVRIWGRKPMAQSASERVSGESRRDGPDDVFKHVLGQIRMGIREWKGRG